LRDGKAMLRDLLDASERRYKELDRTKPPAFLLYVDQGEELYVRAEEHQRHRFSEVIAEGVADPRLYMLMSMRSDFLGELQKDEPLFKVHRKIDVPPLREAERRPTLAGKLAVFASGVVLQTIMNTGGRSRPSFFQSLSSSSQRPPSIARGVFAYLRIASGLGLAWRPLRSSSEWRCSSRSSARA
jgi:hypothetical protein